MTRPWWTAVRIVAVAVAAGTPAVALAGKDVEGVVNLNTATAEELQLLPGVGPAKVRNIVAYRRRHYFRTPEELVRIKGIGRRMVRALRSHIVVVGLTTAKTAHRAPGEIAPVPAPRVSAPRRCLPQARLSAPRRAAARPALPRPRASLLAASPCLPPR